LLTLHHIFSIKHLKQKLDSAKQPNPKSSVTLLLYLFQQMLL
jgi:hypothetical protein